MHNLVLSPIDPEELIRRISDQVTENILKAVKNVNTSSKQSNDFLTLKEAATFLGLAPATIYTMVSKGQLPFMKRTKHLYFSTSELTEYLIKGQKKSLNQIDAETESYLKVRQKK